MQCLNCDSPRLVYDSVSDAYVCLDCGYKFYKQYFFISHSHLDIEKVRIIRNIIEETFFYEPILFFLKCLSDEDELQNLIRREINERIWFVYCKSKNAENSRYVRDERAYLQQLKEGGKKFNELTVELDKFEIWDRECYDFIRNQIAFQIRKTKPFICYSMADTPVARAIYRQLQYNGYSVWTADPSAGLGDWGASVKSKIKEHSYRDGCILLVISDKTLESGHIEREINCAIAENAFIVPVLCSGGEGAAQLWQRVCGRYPVLADRRYITFDVADPDASAEDVFRQLFELQP